MSTRQLSISSIQKIFAEISKRRRFQEGHDFCTKFDPLNDFLYGELHIILKPRKVKNFEHSIFQIIEKTCLRER